MTPIPSDGGIAMSDRKHTQQQLLEVDLEQKLVSISVRFYRSSSGNEPVREWLRGLPLDDRRKIGADIATVQFGWPVGMPLCRSLGDGVWEIRSALPSNRIARLLFFIDQGEIGIVHGFIKKTSKTPPDAIGLARRRSQEMKE
jgi:phage-related protein